MFGDWLVALLVLLMGLGFAWLNYRIYEQLFTLRKGETQHTVSPFLGFTTYSLYEQLFKLNHDEDTQT
jgi:hypothetical protein